MITGALATVEKLFWAMLWVVALMLLAYWVFGFAENKGQGTIIGNIAQWFNDHLRPQAS